MRPRPARCSKVKYPTKALALRVMHAMAGRGRAEQQAYRCGKHNSETWHLSSNPILKPKQRKRR